MKEGLDMNLYEILSVSRLSSLDEIKQSYKKLLLAVHPDKAITGGGNSEFLLVQHAFSVLRDPVMRKHYDEELARRKLLKVHVSEVVDASSMVFCEEDASLTRSCRCGGEHKMSSDDVVESGSIVIECSGCSIKIEVVL
jgi:curved DNA-binding protein CbpA